MQNNEDNNMGDWEDNSGTFGMDQGEYKREAWVTALSSTMLERMPDKSAKEIVQRVVSLANELELQNESTWDADWNQIKKGKSAGHDMQDPEDFKF